MGSRADQHYRKEVVKKYKGKGGYSAEGLEQRVTYIIRIMFMNNRVKKIDSNNKFILMKHSFFYRYNLHNYLNSFWRLFC